MVPVRPGGGLISHTHDSSTPKLHPGRVLGSTAIFTAAAPGVDLRKCVSLCILQYTTVYYSILQYTTVHYITLHLQVHLSTLFFICILPPLILFSLPLSSSPPPPILFSLPLSSSPFPYPLPPLPSPPPFSYSPSFFTSISLYCSDWQCSKKSIGNLGCSTRRTTGPFFLTRDLNIARGLVG